MQYLQLQYKHKQIEIKTSQISYYVMILTWLIKHKCIYFANNNNMYLITILHTFGILRFIPIINLF